MIHGIQVVENILLWLLFVLTPAAEFLANQMGVTDATLVRVIHGLCMAFFSWRIWTGVYGEKDQRKGMAHRFHRPYYWLSVLGIVLVALAFFNFFGVIERLTGMLGGASPFQPASEEAASATFRIGERLVAGLLTAAGVLCLKRSVYGKPRPPKEKQEKVRQVTVQGPQARPTARGARKAMKEQRKAAKAAGGAQRVSSFDR